MIVCDHPGCGKPARRVAVRIETWDANDLDYAEDEVPTNETVVIADLCDNHLQDLHDAVGVAMRRDDEIEPENLEFFKETKFKHHEGAKTIPIEGSVT